MSEAQKGAKKGRLFGKRRKLTAGETDPAAKKTSASSPDGNPELLTLPEDHFDEPDIDSNKFQPTNQAERHSLRVGPSQRSQSTSRMSRGGTLARASSDSMGFDETHEQYFEDEGEALENPHDCSVSTDGRRKKKGEGKKGKKSRKPKGTINKGGARQQSAGACCSANEGACTIF